MRLFSFSRPRIGARNGYDAFADENRIIAEGQKDGERNIPEMGSYMPAQFEQALIAHGEQDVHRIFKHASLQLAKLLPLFQAYQKRLQDIEQRLRPVFEQYKKRAADLGRDVAIPFPFVLHVALIAFLGIGEFPLNTVVFRLFGEAEYLTYIMSSTLAVTIPLIGVFIGIHLRHSLPRVAGNILIGALTPAAVGAALFAVSVLRNTYISSQFGGAGAVAAGQANMAYTLFALNALVFFGAMVASFFSHDPDEKLDFFHHTMMKLERRRNWIRHRLYKVGTRINGEIGHARSQIEQIRALTSQRVALYRQTNMRFRRLLPPPSFRRNPEFPPLAWWPEVSIDVETGSPNGR